VIPAALLALACGRGDRARADDDLSHDLALAASDGLEMAPSAHTNVVSAVELGTPAPVATPVTKRVPKRGTARPRQQVVQTTTDTAAKETILEPTTTPTVIAESPQPTVTAPVPTPAPRPAPLPTPLPTGEGNGGYGDHGTGGAGRVIGTVLGVLIRGGAIGDDDHCEIRPPRGGRAGVLINNRFPVGTFPRTGGTFPQRGGGRFPF
jgi:hypothetical protein